MSSRQLRTKNCGEGRCGWKNKHKKNLGLSPGSWSRQARDLLVDNKKLVIRQPVLGVLLIS